MCGIAGLLYFNDQRRVDSNTLKGMCDAIIHRGPDDEGFHLDGHFGMGMRRLQVIDLKTGHQPISNEDGRIWIVFNGEVYNFPVLRQDLEAKGHTFSTHTDTETIIHAYEEYGDDCVQHLNGMFGFAIWDSRRSRLFLARDRLGVKPLYYYLDSNLLAFGSEIKALLRCQEVRRKLNFEALDTFLTFEYIPAPLSILEGICKLPPGHVLIAQNGKTFVKQYWDVPHSVSTSHHTEQEIEEELYALLTDSTKLRLISDVPLGAFLSGGVDSSTIVQIMATMMEQPVKTFSIGFDDASYNELAYARKVSKQFDTEHHELTIQPEIVTLVEHFCQYVDEPLGDVSVFPTYLVSQLARQYVTVVLSGDGGDELFAGYDWYVASKLDGPYQKIPSFMRKLFSRFLHSIRPTSQKKGLINKIKRFVEGATLDPSLQHFRWNMYLTDLSKHHLYSPDVLEALEGKKVEDRFVQHLEKYRAADPLWRQEYADIKTFLVDDVLVKVDRMSMAHSLEARTPFLDYRVVEFAARVPSQQKIRGLKTKWLLKRCMEQKLPHDILYRKKEGFSIPMKNWLKQELRPLMEDVLSKDRIKKDGLFNEEYVETLKADHLSGRVNNAHQLWSLMVFSFWKDKYLN